MTDCCSSPHQTASRFFSRWSKSYARRFRRRGLEKAQRYLLRGVRDEPVASKEILDIGCGVGSLHLTLLQEGAKSATGIDLSEGMLNHARRLAEDLTVKEKTEYIVGDFVQVSENVNQADITLLDKVLCCYEDYEALIEKSTGKTRSIYGVTHPKDNWLMKFGFKAEIALTRIFHGMFRPYWHNWNLIQQKIIDRGFRLVYRNSTFAWQVLVYKRL